MLVPACMLVFACTVVTNALDPGRTQGNALGVIASARCNDAPLQFLGGQLSHAVVGPAQLEREDRLQILPFQQHGVVQTPAQVGGRVEWCLHRDVVDARPKDPLQVVGHRVILTSAPGPRSVGRTP